MSRQKLEDGDTTEETTEYDETIHPPTYIVLQIGPEVPQNTISWLVDKIRGHRRDGGGELILMKQPGLPEDVGINSAVIFSLHNV